MGTFRHILVFSAILSLAHPPVGAQSTRSSSIKENRAFIYHGKIVRPDGSLPDGSISVKLGIYSPDPKLCLLWAETQTVELKNGGFSMELGHSVNRIAGGAGGAAADFKQVFVNNPSMTIAATSCKEGNSYTPSAADDRLLVASFNDNGKIIEIAGLPIKSVPYALQAEEIGGFGLANLMKIDGSSNVTFSPAEVQSLKDMLGANIDWDMKSRKVTKVADPVANDDAANRGWVVSEINTRMTSAGFGTVTNVTVGGAPLSVTNGSTTPQISIAQANTTTAGYLSSADWNTFNGKQAAGNYLTALTGDVTATGPGSAAATIAANAVVTAKISDKAVTLAKIQDVATNTIAGRSTAGAGALEQITVGSGLSLSGGTLTATGSGGTVTSVGLSVPAYMTAGADITTSGDIALSFNSQAQNSVFAGPATGGAGAVSFRALDPADIPSLNTSKLNAGTLPLARGGTGVSPTGVIGDANKIFGLDAAGTGGEMKTITQGAGVSVTHGVGTITISATGSGGTVTNVGVGGLPLSVVNATSSPTISIAQANTTTAGYLSAADWNTFNGKLTTTLTQNQVWQGNASNVATAGFLGIGQLRNNLGNLQFPSACGAHQTLVWSAINDVLVCSDINNLNADKLTAGTLPAGRFPALTGAITTTAGSLATTLSSNSVGTANITDNTVANADLRQSAARSIVGNGTNATANVADISGTANQVLRVDSAGTGLSFGAINLASSAAVSGYLPVANIAAAGAAAGNFLQGNGTWSSIPSTSITGLGTLADNNSVDLSGAEATGFLAAGRFPALTGAITTTQGSLATTLSNNAVTTVTINNLAVTDAKINDVAWSKITGEPTTLAGYGITDGVRSVIAGTGLTGGTITSSGTIALADSGVTAGSYPKVTVDIKGRVTAGSALALADVTTGLGYTPVNKAGDTMTGNLSFSAANPTITSGSSYIIVPNGLYVSGGTPYFANEIKARGGIANDTAATLTVDGGTSGYTNFTGNVGVGVAAPGQKLVVAGVIQSTTGGIRFPDGTTQTTAASAGASGSCRLCMTPYSSASYGSWGSQVCTAYSTGTLQIAEITSSSFAGVRFGIQCQ